MIETRVQAPASNVELVRRHGGPLAHAALVPANDTFRAPGIGRLMGFRAVHGCAVVPGDPVCVPEQLGPLAEAFTARPPGGRPEG
jgi:hypothetical protein